MGRLAAPAMANVMNKLLTSVIVALLLASCSSPPSTEALAAKYSVAPEAFEVLKKMITDDTAEKECFVVGLDNIGEYWEYNGEWTRNSDYKTRLSLSEVLKEVGLTEKRYGEYKKLFAKTGSERVKFCHALEYAPEEVNVLVYRAGLSVSGCSGEINWRHEPLPSSTGKKEEGDFSEITQLGNGWYLDYQCN